MNSLNLAWRSLPRRGRHNGIKILSLSIGLALGMILIAKMRFEQSFETFYPDLDRLYMIYNTTKGPEGTDNHPQVCGAIAVGMKAEIPEIEAATRITDICSDAVFRTETQQKLTGTFFLADSCFFDVLPRPMLLGNAKEVLARPQYALVSRSLAQRIGQGTDVIGQRITIDIYPNAPLTIGGVFEDLPENSMLHYDVLVSLPSISRFMRDGSLNWYGNDRYVAYVKLAPGVDPASLKSGIHRTLAKYTDLEAMHKIGYQPDYTLRPITALYANDPQVRQMIRMLALLAFALLFTASMNYILLVISSLVKRSKEMGVLKCYGASGKNIYQIILSETGLHIVLALGIAALLIIAFQGTIEQLLATSLSALFTDTTCLILCIVIGLVFLLTGTLPAYLFTKISVTSAFRQARGNRNRLWKHTLLFIQFSAATLLITLLILIGRQYHMMIHNDPGYTYDKLLYCSTSGVKPELRQTALEELNRLPFVEKTSSAATLPFRGASGNNVRDLAQEKELFNFADLYGVDTDYFSLMEIPIIAGENFRPRQSDTTQAMVSRVCADRISQLMGWQDGVIGKSLIFTEHWKVTICGVYEDIQIGNLAAYDNRPSALFYSPTPEENLLIRLRDLKPEYIRQITDMLTRLMPDRDIQVIPYASEMVAQYADSKRFRNTVLAGSLITLLIALIGLIGYIQDETSRRRKEIAIRKINGATATLISRLMIRNVLWIALPATVLGSICTLFIGQKWLENFAEKVSLSLPTFLLGSVMVLGIISGCIILLTRRIANDNPVNSLKTE